MAYKSGELQVVVACAGVDEYGFCQCHDTGWINPPAADYVEPHGPVPYDSRQPYMDEPKRRKAAAFLPHSCDQWVIGGVEEVDALIADLQAAREKLAEAGA